MLVSGVVLGLYRGGGGALSAFGAVINAHCVINKSASLQLERLSKAGSESEMPN